MSITVVIRKKIIIVVNLPYSPLQVLSTVVNGSLPKEGEDFQVFDFTDDDIDNLEDGLMVNKTWLEDPANEETLIRFLKARALILQQ